jgi:hypothetical protein
LNQLTDDVEREIATGRVTLSIAHRAGVDALVTCLTHRFDDEHARLMVQHVLTTRPQHFFTWNLDKFGLKILSAKISKI